jgi:hypothetical protein
MKWPMLFLSVLFAAPPFGQAAANAPADMAYGKPGQSVDAGGFRLNLYCMGNSSPTVVFDSGFGDWAPATNDHQSDNGFHRLRAGSYSGDKHRHDGKYHEHRIIHRT